MITTILNRQSEGKVTTVRDLAKKFKVGTTEVIDAVSAGAVGYTVQFSDLDPKGTTEITVTEAEQKVEFHNHDTYTDEPVLAEPVEISEEEYTAMQVTDEMPVYVTDEDIEAVQPVNDAEFEDADFGATFQAAVKPVKVARSRAFRPGVYPCYSATEAAEMFDEGYISITEVVKCFQAKKISISRLVKALGSERLRGTPLNENWIPFTIGTQVKRYIRKAALSDIDSFKDDEIWKELWAVNKYGQNSLILCTYIDK